jgi:hypothetical protein
VLRTETVDGKEVPVVGGFVWFTYTEVQAMIDKVGAGIIHLDLAPPNDTGVRRPLGGGRLRALLRCWVLLAGCCTRWG